MNASKKWGNFRFHRELILFPNLILDHIPLFKIDLSDYFTSEWYVSHNFVDWTKLQRLSVNLIAIVLFTTTGAKNNRPTIAILCLFTNLQNFNFRMVIWSRLTWAHTLMVLLLSLHTLLLSVMVKLKPLDAKLTPFLPLTCALRLLWGWSSLEMR